VSSLDHSQTVEVCDRENLAGSFFHPLFSVALLMASNSLEAESWFKSHFCPIHPSLKSQPIQSLDIDHPQAFLVRVFPLYTKSEKWRGHLNILCLSVFISEL